MKPSPFQILWLVLGAGVAAGALLVAGTRTPSGAPSPFGFPQIVLAQTLAALPLAWVAAAALGEVLPALRYRILVPFWAGIALLLAWLTWRYGDRLGPRLDQNHLGAGVRLLVRVLWCQLLTFPWALVAVGWTSGEGDHDRTPAMVPSVLAKRALLLTGVLLAAVAPPLAYINYLAAQKLAAANQALDLGNVVRAMEPLAGLSDLDWHDPAVRFPNGQVETPADALQLARELIAEAHRQIEHFESQTGGTPREQALRRMAIARTWLRLNRPELARTALEPLLDVQPGAVVLAARARQEEGQWTSAINGYRKAVEMLERANSEDPAVQENYWTAYTQMAFCYRELRDFNAAERAYQEALEKLPQREAALRFQLGRHYQLAGRPADAQAQWLRAVQLAPTEFQREVERLSLEQAQGESPGCLVGRWPGIGSGED